MEEFLKAGIPLAKINRLLPLLEKNGCRLTSSTHFRNYVSLVFKKEIGKIKKKLSFPGQGEVTREVSVVFDGSTTQEEAIATIVCFIDDRWVITQRRMKN